jgi:hypothetical protein
MDPWTLVSLGGRALRRHPNPLRSLYLLHQSLNPLPIPRNTLNLARPVPPELPRFVMDVFHLHATTTFLAILPYRPMSALWDLLQQVVARVLGCARG